MGGRPSHRQNNETDALLIASNEIVLALAHRLSRFRSSLAARDTLNDDLAAENAQLQERVRVLETQCAQMRDARTEIEAETWRMRQELMRSMVREAARRVREAEGVRLGIPETAVDLSAQHMNPIVGMKRTRESSVDVSARLDESLTPYLSDVEEPKDVEAEVPAKNTSSEAEECSVKLEREGIFMSDLEDSFTVHLVSVSQPKVEVKEEPRERPSSASRSHRDTSRCIADDQEGNASAKRRKLASRKDMLQVEC